MKCIFKRFSCMLLTLFIIAYNVTPALAVESSTSSNQLEPLTESSDISRAEALEILGITEEELGNAQLYTTTANIPVATSTDLVIGVGGSHIFPPLTFTNSNIGQPFAMNGSQVMYGISWRWLNAYDRNAVSLHVRLINTNASHDYSCSGFSGWGNGGTNSIQSNWCKISPSYSYHFVYTTNYSYTVEATPDISIYAVVVVAVI